MISGDFRFRNSLVEVLVVKGVDVAKEVHSLYGLDYVLVHFDSLLLPSNTVVVYTSGFEQAQPIQCGEFKNRLDSLLVITGLENTLSSVMKVLNSYLRSPFFSLGEVLCGEL